MRQAFWDGYARIYDSIWASPLGVMLADAITIIAGPPGQVVEVGAGTGLVGATLASAGHQVICLDTSVAMLRRARARGLSVAVSRAEHLPMRPGSADIVVAANLLHLHPDPGLVVESMIRLRAAGGRVICSWPRDDLGPLGVAAAERRLGVSRSLVAARTVARYVVGLAGLMVGWSRHDPQTLMMSVNDAAARHGLGVRSIDLASVAQTLVILGVEKAWPGSATAGHHGSKAPRTTSAGGPSEPFAGALE